MLKQGIYLVVAFLILFGTTVISIADTKGKEIGLEDLKQFIEDEIKEDSIKNIKKKAKEKKEVKLKTKKKKKKKLKTTPKTTKYSVVIEVNDNQLGYTSAKQFLVSKGEKITLLATPFDKAQFQKWTGNIKIKNSFNNKLDFIVNKNLKLKANFIPNKVTLVVNDQFNQTTKVSKEYPYDSYIEWETKSPYYITDKIRYITPTKKVKTRLKKNTVVNVKWIKQFFVEIPKSDSYKIVGQPTGWVNKNELIKLEIKLIDPSLKFIGWKGIKRDRIYGGNPMQLKVSSPRFLKPIIEVKKVKVQFLSIDGEIKPYAKGLYISKGSVVTWENPQNKMIGKGIRLNSRDSQGGKIIAEKDLLINPDWFKEFKISTYTIKDDEKYLSAVSWQKQGHRTVILADQEIKGAKFAYWTGDVTRQQQYQNPLVLEPAKTPLNINAHYTTTPTNTPVKKNPIDRKISHFFTTGKMKIIKESNRKIVPLRYIDFNNNIRLYGYYPKGTVVDLKALGPKYISAFKRYNFQLEKPIVVGEDKVAKLKWHREFLVKQITNDLDNGKVLNKVEKWVKKGHKFKLNAPPIAGKTFFNWSGDVPKAYINNPFLKIIAERPLTIILNYQNLPEKIAPKFSEVLNSKAVTSTYINDWNGYGKCIKLSSLNIEAIISVKLGQVLYFGLPKETKNFLWVNTIDYSLQRGITKYTYSGQSTFVEPKEITQVALDQEDNQIDGIEPRKIKKSGNRIEMTFADKKSLNLVLKKIFILGDKAFYSKTLFLTNDSTKTSKFLIAPTIITQFSKPLSVKIHSNKIVPLSTNKGEGEKNNKSITYTIDNTNHNFKVASQDSSISLNYQNHKLNIEATKRFGSYYPNKDNIMTFFAPKNHLPYVEVAFSGGYTYLGSRTNSFSEVLWTLE